MKSDIEVPNIPPVPSLCVIGGLMCILLSFTKISGNINIAVIAGKETELLLIGISLLIIGISSFIFVFRLLISSETKRNINAISFLALLILSIYVASYLGTNFHNERETENTTASIAAENTTASIAAENTTDDNATDPTINENYSNLTVDKNERPI